MQNILLGVLFLTSQPAYAETKDIVPVIQQLTIPELITFYSIVYNVDKEIINKVVNCESSFNPLAVGDNGHSRGLVQIHKPSHPNITDEQAFSPVFSLNFLAKNLSEGKGKMWTCYRNLYL